MPKHEDAQSWGAGGLHTTLDTIISLPVTTKSISMKNEPEGLQRQRSASAFRTRHRKSQNRTMSQMAGGAPSLYGYLIQRPRLLNMVGCHRVTEHTVVRFAHNLNQSVPSEPTLASSTQTARLRLPCPVDRPNKRHTICWGAPPQQPLKQSKAHAGVTSHALIQTWLLSASACLPTWPQ